jgi:hypothetical protein
LGHPGKALEQIVVSGKGGSVTSAHKLLLGLLPAHNFSRLAFQFNKVVLQYQFLCSSSGMTSLITTCLASKSNAVRRGRSISIADEIRLARLHDFFQKSVGIVIAAAKAYGKIRKPHERP